VLKTMRTTHQQQASKANCRRKVEFSGHWQAKNKSGATRLMMTANGLPAGDWLIPTPIN
jgi:hypothetical protein